MNCIHCDKGGDVTDVIITVLLAWNFMIYTHKFFRFMIKRQKELVLALKNLVTLLVITYQIIVDLSRVHRFKGGQGYPDLFRRFMHYLELVASLDVVRCGYIAYEVT